MRAAIEVVAVRAAVAALLADAVAGGVTPGAVVEAGRASGAVFTNVAGRLTYADDAAAVTTATVYDLASLTKVIATTTLAMQAHAAGRLTLDTRLAAHLGLDTSYGVATIRDLLEHAAGFPAHRPFYRQVAGRAAYLARLVAEPATSPPRTASVYTDLGAILLGLLLERTGDAPLDAQFAAFVGEVLGPADLTFCPPAAWRARLAPTSLSPWRGRVVVGAVHDDNAAALGGVAGHAGLFGTAAGVGAFARWLLAHLIGDGPPWRDVTSALVRQFATPSTVPGSSRALGWDTMRPTSSCGTRLSAQAIGHTGFTGTSLWIDPVRDLYVVTLTNRVHPTGEREGIHALRVAVHDAVADAWLDPG